MLAQLKNVIKQWDARAGYRLCIRSFSIRKGEYIAITGQSGCGKSTALDLLGMVLRPDSAEEFTFSFDEEKCDAASFWEKGQTAVLTDLRRRRMGYVLQTGGLFPFLSVWENILLGARAAGISEAQAEPRVEDLMERLEINRLRKRKPEELSIGERQRVAIARALAPGPGLLLADEPTAALDPGLSRRVMKLFLEAVQESRTSVVMVSHDVALVHEFAFREAPIFVQSEGDRVSAVLDDRQGEE